MKYITTVQAAKKWNISANRVFILAREGKISNAIQIGSRWLIPENAQKPQDGRMKKTKAENIRKNFFRYPIFEYKDLDSFEPPLSNEELTLKNAFEAYHACKFEDANSILGDLPKNKNNKYIRITALYLGCMVCVFLCDTKRFFEYYGNLTEELQDDFEYKTEMQEYLFEIKAALGIDGYCMYKFNLKPNYEYHQSFIPHLSALCAIQLTFPDANITQTDLTFCELNCIYLSQSNAYVYTQATHVYLSAGYVLLGNTDKATYHFKKALNLAEKYNLYYIPAEQYAYMPKMLQQSLDSFSDDFKQHFLTVCDDVYNRYTQFTDEINTNNISKILSYKDYILIYYAVKGYPNKKIAELLKTSIGNVGKRYGELYLTLGVKSKKEIVDLYKKISKL